MKKLIFVLTLVLVLYACSKGDDFCEDPNPVSGFMPLDENYPPNEGIEVSLDVYELFNADQNKTLYSFTVPDVFINPKGENYLTDVVKAPTYTYYLKDSLVYPDSVLIEGYSFNDCARSDIATAWIRF